MKVISSESSWHPPQINLVSGFAHALVWQVGQVYLVLLAGGFFLEQLKGGGLQLVK
jgi:hypothetical protein